MARIEDELARLAERIEQDPGRACQVRSARAIELIDSLERRRDQRVGGIRALGRLEFAQDLRYPATAA